MPISQEQNAWLHWVLITSIPLRHLNDDRIPVDFASGCLIDCNDRRYLLSVEHAIKQGSRSWVVDLGCNATGETRIFEPSRFDYIQEHSVTTNELRTIDFCFTEVPNSLVSFFQFVTPQAVSNEKPRHVFHIDQISLPDANQTYAFSGQVKPEQHDPRSVAFDFCVYPGLRFLRTEGEFHLFQLPVAHPGHDNFKGCSGAPIVDTNKRVVALVCDGDTSLNIIRGVSLKRYAAIFSVQKGGSSA